MVRAAEAVLAVGLVAVAVLVAAVGRCPNENVSATAQRSAAVAVLEVVLVEVEVAQPVV